MFVSVEYRDRGRRFRVYYPAFEIPQVHDIRIRSFCSQCGSESPGQRTADGKFRCTKCGNTDNFILESRPMLELDATMRETDFRKLWPLVEEFLASYPGRKPPLGAATEQVLRWLYYRLCGKPYEEIASLELRRKSTKDKWLGYTRKRLARIIKEALRHRLPGEMV